MAEDFAAGLTDEEKAALPVPPRDAAMSLGQKLSASRSLIPVVLLIAWGLGAILRNLLGRIARHTVTEWDDLLLEHLRGPFRLWAASLAIGPLLSLLDLNTRVAGFFTSLTRGLVLINEMYFQHIIIESAAHWMDSPWRPVNNLNQTGFIEPPPVTGDTIKMADAFYDVTHLERRALHRAYIRQCLANLADETNVIHTLSAENSGPLHFMQFWLDVVAEWEAETGKHPLIALSAPKDVQDAILADAKRSALIDVIDLTYWWRTEKGDEFAPPGGQSLAPRQHLRAWKGGKPSAATIAAPAPPPMITASGDSVATSVLAAS